MFTEQEINAALKDSRDFRPFAHYDAETDSLEFIASNQSFYAESIDPLVTIYYSHDTNSLVGLRMKKVKKFFRDFLRNSPGFK